MTNFERIKAMTIEEMADIRGYEGLYKIDRFGNVYSQYTNRVLKPAPTSWGYITVELFKDKVGKTHKIHKLVADAYIPNPNGKPIINHIDGDKKNNAVENLEWCTYSENMKHAWKNGLTQGNKTGINQWKEVRDEAD